MISFSIEGKMVSVFPASQPDAPAIYLNTVSNEGMQIWQAMQALSSPPLTLVTIGGLDWNHDISPWDSPAVFPNTPAFTGGANNYLCLLTQVILPAAEAQLAAPPSWRGIAGYSLAGAFALYALCHTDCFSRAASISGSLWFPGLKDYLLCHPPQRQPRRLYLSLGDREHKVRDPLLQSVLPNTQRLYQHYQSCGIDVQFQLNKGNHFHQAAQRTAAGIYRLLEE